MHGVSTALVAKANRRGDADVPKDSQGVEQGISFRALARFAFPHKTAFALAALTGASDRTAKRWLAGDGALPWSAVSVVLQEIIRRLN